MDPVPHRHTTCQGGPGCSTTVWAAFRDAAGAHPDAPAILGQRTELTYQQLHDTACAIAHRLQDLGVRHGDRVALLCTRDVLVPAAMLGIVSIGAVFVPIETDAPPARRARILELAGCVRAISNLAAGERPDGTLDLEEIAAPVPPTSTTTHSNHASEPDQAAAVMFTSGSTGQPKGVLIPHRAVVRLARAGLLELGPGCRFLHASSLAFDASTLEIWGPLLNGGTVIVLEANPNPRNLDQIIRSKSCTATWLTAALFHLCADTDPTLFAPLTTLLTGGDVVSPRHAAAVLRANPNLRLVNGYGPTENTTFTTTHDITDPDPAIPLPIGRPIAGTGVAIVDPTLHPVRQGEIGELLATGDGLALGYLNDPELTAARFVILPGSSERAYRTGDLARLDPQGRIEFHGRNDHQVKIRGFRVEPAEIEAALRALPAIRDAVVVMAAPNGELLPHAFVTTDPIESWPEHRALLRARLSQALPAYALPASITLQATMPLSASGKADRNALRKIIELGEPIGLAPDNAQTAIQAAANRLDQYWNPYPEASDSAPPVLTAAPCGHNGSIDLRAPCGGRATLDLHEHAVLLKLPPGTSQHIRQWRCADAAAMLRDDMTQPGNHHALMCDDERAAVQGWLTHRSTQPNGSSLWTELVNAASLHSQSHAIIDSAGTITYADLIASCRSAAASLVQSGVSPGEVLALTDRRDTQSLIWLFAVLSIGCVCVPITPQMPPDRAESIIRIAHATRMIDPAHDGLYDPAALAPTLLRNRAAPMPDAPHPIGRDALILFTSGSTAEPKGIRLRHDSILSTVAWFTETFPLNERDVVTQRSWLSWDCSVLEIVWPLLSGAAVAVIDPAITKDPATFARSAHALGATVLVTVPSIVTRICREIAHTDRSPIRAVICAGERLTPADAREVIQLTGADLYNVYGPSETSVITNCWKASAEFDEVPVGRPGRDVILRIENDKGSMCPVGVTGEILIQGIQVSHGYINPAEQAPNPFSRSPTGAMSYRTGDLGYWREDGRVCFVGRRDAQIKIFGYRIEPEEIESLLSRVPGIKDAAVTTHAEGTAKAILAFCVPETASESPPDPADIVKHLRGKLEPHAVPGRFHWISDIPRLPNGKIDRRAVTTLAHARLGNPTTPGNPEGATSADIPQQVRQVWTTLLGHPPVSDDADFIASGGNSLLLLRLFLLLEQSTGLELPILPSLQNQSPASIAHAFITHRASHRAAIDGREVRANFAGHLHKLTDGPQIVLAIPHLGGTLGYLTDVANAMYGQAALYGIRPTGLLAGETPVESIPEMIRGYTQLATAQGWERIKLVGFSSGATIAIDLARSLTEAGIRVEQLYLADGIPCHRPPLHPKFRKLYIQIMWRVPKRFAPLTAPSTRPYDLSGYQDQQLTLARSTLHALFRHRPGHYHGPATIISTTRSTELASPQSWSRVLKGPVGHILLDGAGHSSLWQPPYHTTVAEALINNTSPIHGPARSSSHKLRRRSVASTV